MDFGPSLDQNYVTGALSIPLPFATLAEMLELRLPAVNGVDNALALCDQLPRNEWNKLQARRD